MRKQTSKKLEKIYNEFSGTITQSDRNYLRSIRVLINLAEEREPYTRKHSIRVSNYAVMLAKSLALPKEEIQRIRIAAMLHDIGKIGIDRNILLKKGPLSKKEYNAVKRHSEFGAEILRPLKFFDPIASIIRHHHENYDGTGYPDGLKGEDIPRASRIISIADSYDALTSKRTYRNAYSEEEAKKIMRGEAGTRFDTLFLKKFIDCLCRQAKTGKK